MNPVTENPLLIKLTSIPETPGWKRKLVLALRVILVSIHRFNVDDCLMKASGLAYTTIVTLVPTLTVAFALLTVASGIQGRQDEIYEEVNSFLLKNNIQFDISPYWETLSDIINTASQIGAVGFIVFIFSATAVLRSLEKTFHSIWNIDVHRSFINKFVFYFFLITFGPLLFVVGKGISNQLTDAVRAPHLKSIVLTDKGDIWVAGEKGNIGVLSDLKSKIKFIPKDSIDFENMLCVDFTTIESGTCKKPNIGQENFFRIRSFADHLTAISEEGTLLISKDHGNSWNVHSLKNITVTDFGVASENTFFILTADTKTLRYEVGKSLIELKKFSTKDITPVKIRFFGANDGFILDREGRLWKTTDGGFNFSPQVISKKALNDIYFLSRNIGFVVGDNGAIFRTKDGGNTWIDINHKKFSYDRVWAFLSPKKQDFDLFILNNLGEILLSEDEGENWSIAYKPKGGAILDLIHLRNKQSVSGLATEPGEIETLQETEIKDDLETTNKLNADMLGILGVGEYNKVIRIENDDNGKPIWKKYQGGLKIFSLYTLLQLILPLLSIWVFFVLLYTIIPNTKVPIRASFLGAAITGIILILFFWGFLNIYLTSFTEKTMIIYKALAAIPIFLLTIYSVGVIVLFGAEVTATLQFPDRYLLPRHPFESIDTFIKHEFYHTIKFFIKIYESQEKSGKLISIKEIRSSLLIPEKDAKLIQENLEKAGLISVSEKGHLAPVKLKEQVSLLELYEKTVSSSFGAPTERDSNLSKVNDSLQDLDSKLKAQLKGIFIKDLMV
ncbi:MAG: YhjD/YihY/BrkB family envelope integrity protein [Leptospira sp.]|nr:YhjD/YihY/BrkB family envelope integrity protein [Leptospira sp.]